ncbi:MAG: hypothetical protein QXE81_03450 [Desulfurococcaceae archaeon]
MKNKCIEDQYLDFLIYLNTIELNRFKIYDLFRAISIANVEMSECYNDVARKYLMLESWLGDPGLALYKLGDIVNNEKLSNFLKGYSNVLFTSGDTLTYTSNALKTEFYSLKARISESLKMIEVLIESVLVVVLALSILILIPIWQIPRFTGYIALGIIGLFSYVLGLRVSSVLYNISNLYIHLVDLVILIISCVLLGFPLGVLAVTLILFTLFCVTRPFIRLKKSIEKEAIRILGDVYSSAMLGVPVDTALLESLRRTSLAEYRLLMYSLLNGLRVNEFLESEDLTKLANKIMVMLTGMIDYFGASSTYLASIVNFVDEVTGLRHFVEEKLNHYLIYSIILAFLITACYLMIKLVTPINVDLHTLGLHGYLGIIVISIPICVIKDGGFSVSKSMIMMASIALLVFILITIFP